MSANMKRGQTGMVGGPLQAKIFPNVEVATNLIKRAKRPLLIIGSKATEKKTNDGDIIDSAIRAMRNKKLTVVATGHLVSEFRKRGVEGANSMPLFVLGKYLSDSEWMGFDGEGQYDTAIFIGYPYYMEWLVESGLKNFTKLRTISLDRTYQPNAQWSFGWMTIPDWQESINTIISSIEEDA